MNKLLLPIAIVVGFGAGAGVLFLVARKAPTTPAPGPAAEPGKAPKAGPDLPPFPADGVGLFSPDEPTRRKAVSGLQVRPDKNAVPDLLKMLEHEEHPGIRNLIYAALAKCGDESLVPELLRRFQSEAAFPNRYGALEAAVDIGGPQVVALADKLIRIPDVAREDALILDLAARALVENEDPNQIPALEEFLHEATQDIDEDPHRSARISVMEQMGNAGGKNRAASLERLAASAKYEETLREEAVDNLASMQGREGLEALMRLLERFMAAGEPHEDATDMREVVLRAFGKRLEPEALEVLKPYVDGTTPVSPGLRREAVSAAGDIAVEMKGEEMDHAHVVALLLAVTKDAGAAGEVRGEAWSAYARILGDLAAPALLDGARLGASPEERLAATRGFQFVSKAVRAPMLQDLASSSTDEKVKQLANTLLK